MSIKQKQSASRASGAHKAVRIFVLLAISHDTSQNYIHPFEY